MIITGTILEYLTEYSSKSMLNRKLAQIDVVALHHILMHVRMAFNGGSAGSLQRTLYM